MCKNSGGAIHSSSSQYREDGALAGLWNWIEKFKKYLREDKKAYETLKRLFEYLARAGLIEPIIYDERKGIWGAEYVFEKGQLEKWVKEGKQAYNLAKLHFNIKEGSFLNYLPASSLFSTTALEILPRDHFDINDLEKTYKEWKNLIDTLRVEAVLSTDRYLSVGPLQMRHPFYNVLKKRYNLEKEFYECITKRCQAKAGYLLMFDNLKNFERYYKDRLNRGKKEAIKFKELWEKASDSQRREFIVYISSAFINGGGGSDMFRKILLFSKDSTSLKDLIEQLTYRKMGNETGQSWKYAFKAYSFWKENKDKEEFEEIDDNELEIEEAGGYRFIGIGELEMSKVHLVNLKEYLKEKYNEKYYLYGGRDLLEDVYVLNKAGMSEDEAIEAAKLIVKESDDDWFIRRIIVKTPPVVDGALTNEYISINPRYIKTAGRNIYLMENRNKSTGKKFNSYEELSLELLEKVMEKERDEIGYYEVKNMANLLKMYNNGKDIRTLNYIVVPEKFVKTGIINRIREELEEAGYL